MKNLDKVKEELALEHSEESWDQDFKDYLSSKYSKCESNLGFMQDIEKRSFIKGFDKCAKLKDEEISKLVSALKFECGNRCAHQNPCNAREVLIEMGFE